MQMQQQSETAHKEECNVLTRARDRADTLANVLMLVRQALEQVQAEEQAEAWGEAEEKAEEQARKREGARTRKRMGPRARARKREEAQEWAQYWQAREQQAWTLAQDEDESENEEEDEEDEEKELEEEDEKSGEEEDPERAKEERKNAERQWGQRQRQRQAQAQAGAQGWWAPAQTHMVPYADVLGDSKLMDIIHSIAEGHVLARDLWFLSKSSEHWWLIQIIIPITRLPPELLQQILLIIIDNASDSPLVLMRVSKLWYSIVTGLWGSIKLGTSTPMDAVTRKLERNPSLLDVVVDTEVDRGGVTPSEGAYQAIFASIQAASRWRSLVVESFPAQTDLPEHLVNNSLQQCSDVVMSRLRSFKIKCPCEPSSLLQHLLRILGTAASGELTTVEINSPSVISFLAPTYPSIFHSVKMLCLDIPRLPNPVDLLPHLHRLEELTASHLSLSIYPDDVDIPFVHTLRHLSLRATSIQWMSGRTFHALESCTLIFPLHRRVLHSFSTTLPNCNDLTFQGYPLDILNGISTRNLTHLTVKCSCSEKSRGGRQLVQFSSQALRENRLMPRILHISIDATNQAWKEAFASMSNLEELVIESAQPFSLGVNVLQPLVVHRAYPNNLGTTATHGGRYTPLCPLLKRFGLRYRSWLLSTEHFELIPDLVSIISSRQQSEFPLQSFRLWKESGQQEPLELIERSWISFKSFESLTNTGDLLRVVASRLADGLSRS